VIRPFGDIEDKHIQKEIQTVQNLCDGRHKNIVAVLSYGKLSHGSFYYMDMELCDFNLGTYIYSNPTQGETVLLPMVDDYSKDRVSQIWLIMEAITNGISFIHERKYIHRDLKPRNGTFPISESLLIPVLYSSKHQAWKIADFGLTSEGTSRRANTTTSCRGTAGYRAPELLAEDNPNYTNKVDIWAIGCILYELIFRKKPFRTDLAVAEFARSSRFSGEKLCISQEMFISDDCKVFISAVLTETLAVDYTERPRAKALWDAFLEQRQEISQAVESESRRRIYSNQSSMAVRRGISVSFKLQTYL
jgi:serine/threonine protein kinase